MLDGYRGNWLVRLMTNGFESVMAVYGTEEEMRQYLRSELEGCSFSYVGMSDERYGCVQGAGRQVLSGTGAVGRRGPC